MWTAWADIARTRLAAGDLEGAALAATLANDDGGPCPFTEPELIAGWHAAADLRARVKAAAAAARAAAGPGRRWRPRAGSTQAVHTAGSGGDFDL